MTRTLDLEELRAARAKEQQQSTLTDLPEEPSLFEQVQAAATEEDLDYEDLRKLTTEFVDERLGKLTKLASFAAADLPISTDGMTEREEELVRDMEALLVAYREEVIPEAEPDAQLSDFSEVADAR